MGIGIKKKLDIHKSLMKDISEIIGYGTILTDTGIDYTLDNEWWITEDNNLLIATDKGSDYWSFIINSYASKEEKFYIGEKDELVFIMGYSEDDGWDNSIIFVLSKNKKKYIGICGQGPSDHPDFADWLVKQGISSLSLNPDTVISTWKQITKK